MSQQIKNLVEQVIKELIAGGASVDGSASFRGGPFGFGNKNQLANGLDPSVEKIEKLEQDEINQNLDDQNWNLRKYPKTGPVDQISEIKDTDEEEDEDLEELNERNIADAHAGKLPGFPRMNAIESPVQHLPNENFVVSDLRAGVADGTEDYLIDDMINASEPGNTLNLRTEGAGQVVGGASGGANYPYQMKSALPPFDVSGDDDDDDESQQQPPEQELIGHMSQKKANASPLGGMGNVMFPRKFVPDEQPQQSDIEDEDSDGISDAIDLDKRGELDMIKSEGKKDPSQNTTRHPARYGEKTPSSAQIVKKMKDVQKELAVLSIMLMKAGHGDVTNVVDNFSIRLEDEKQHLSMFGESKMIEEEPIDEKYASKAQQGYFHAKAAEGDPEFKKLAKEFDKETSRKQFKKLPQKVKKESINSKNIKSIVVDEILKALNKR